MTNPKHELKNITDQPEGGLSGECSCGRWAFAGLPNLRALKRKHDEHIREAR